MFYKKNIIFVNYIYRRMSFDKSSFHSNNVEGLNKAYAAIDKYYLNNNKLYLAGTTGIHEPGNFLNDWYHNFRNIPIWGNSKNITRYKTAEKVIKDNPNINEIIGHSQSGTVALELQRQHPNRFKTVTYNAPVLDFGGDSNAQRYRIPGTKIPGMPILSALTGDVVSKFDWSAKPVDTSFFNKLNAWNSHKITSFV